MDIAPITNTIPIMTTVLLMDIAPITNTIPIMTTVLLMNTAIPTTVVAAIMDSAAWSAIAAICSAVTTIALVFLTNHYVHLTSGLLREATKGREIGSPPILLCTISHSIGAIQGTNQGDAGASSIQAATNHLDFTIRNVGGTPAFSVDLRVELMARNVDTANPDEQVDNFFCKITTIEPNALHHATLGRAFDTGGRPRGISVSLFYRNLFNRKLGMLSEFNEAAGTGTAANQWLKIVEEPLIDDPETVEALE